MEEPRPNPDLTSIAGQRVTVMGLGGFGGGAAAVRFLAEQGAIVRVSDQRSADQLGNSISELDDLPRIDWQLGKHDWPHFEDADFVVVNPAVPPHHPIIQKLNAADVPLSSEMNLFWSLNPGRVIGVTGSNGKSTTTALIHSILEADGQRCWLGGNIGRSLLPHLDEISSEDWVVLELSSFQLHLLDRIKARPDIAVVTNFAPNHLDWHRTVEEYQHAKQAILRWQTSDDFCVLNGDDADVSKWPCSACTIWAFDTSDLPHSITLGSREAWLDEHGYGHIHTPEPAVTVSSLPFSMWCRLKGRHNLWNTLLSSTAARLAGCSIGAIRVGLEQLDPLGHRLQLVGEVDGRRFYNDSISTTPESTIAALNSFDEPIVILAGGYDKKVDLSGMALRIADRAKAASLLGETANVLQSEIEARNSSLPTAKCPDFDRAFDWAFKQSSPGDVVLLSPGCASYDWFQTFVDRGDRFTQLVRRLIDSRES